MKKRVLLTVAVFVSSIAATSYALPKIPTDVKPKVDKVFSKLYWTMLKDSEAVRLVKLNAALGKLVDWTSVYVPLDPFREWTKIAILTKIEELNAKAAFRYPECDKPDIAIGRQIWSACNVWSSKSGTWSRNFGDYFTFWNVATVKSVNWKTYDSWKNEWKAKDRGPCLVGYHVPTLDEWKELIGYEGCKVTAWVNKNASCGSKIAEKLALPGAWYHFGKLGFRNASISGYEGNYWTSTGNSKGNAWKIGFELGSKGKDYGITSLSTDSKEYASSVRCIKD